MAVFRDTEQLYQVLGALVERVVAEPEIANRLLEGNLVVRFRYTEPEGGVTIDLRRSPITYTFGASDLEPDVEMIQSGDTSHQFWLGRLSMARAIATRQIVSRGSVPKALALLPAIKPAFDIYPEVLRELGYEEMIPEEQGEGKEKRGGKRKGWLARTVGPRLRRQDRRAEVDYEALNRHFLPVVEEVPDSFWRVEVRAQKLPEDVAALKIEMLRRMRLIRTFEETLAETYARGEIPTEAIHLSIGQEATAVGVCFALQADDYMTTTHRGHGHMLAKGADVKGMMAELFGKETGLCKGKGGSMHVTEAAVGALGANGIVGAPYLIATGAAMSAKYRPGPSARAGSNRVAVAIAGDGSTNQGMFHEALNFAAVFRLPAVFVVENNLYGEFTPLYKHTGVQRLSDRAAAYGIPGVTVDGNDAWAVLAATQEAVARARQGEGPTLLECLTYRWHGHMEGEVATYRNPDEIEDWKQKCPIRRLEGELLESGTLTPDEADEIKRQAEERVSEALAYAQESPEPPDEALTEDVYAPEPAVLYRPAPAQPSTREVTYSKALFEALAEEMSRDERVFLMGEDVSHGGYFAVTAGLADEFGPFRVIDTPISEYAIAGAAVGAAMTGRRPVVEILFSDFITTCMDPIVNQAAKLRYMSGGQYALPLVIRTPGGGGIGMAAQHSQSLEAWLTGIPGLIVIAPGMPHDAKGLLKAAIRSNNPVLFFENKLLYSAVGPVPEEEYLVPIGVADVKRPGEDLTLVAIGAMVGPALEAAEMLARRTSSGRSIDVEVVDPRTLVPCDWATIVRSVVKTGRLVVAEPGVFTHGFGAEVVSRVTETALGALEAPPRRVAGADVPIPYNTRLENAALPDADDILAAVHEIFR
jgi:pyruvate/2-oxoglutarate/acetoin dehydrogenase E1 component/TPP-dependent pyruvate/acetoin dehydrogenase alpha subunit